MGVYCAEKPINEHQRFYLGHFLFFVQIYTENWVNSPAQQEDNSWQAFIFVPEDNWCIAKASHLALSSFAVGTHHLVVFTILSGCKNSARFCLFECYLTQPSKFDVNSKFTLQIPLARYLPTWRGNVIDAQLEMNPSRIVGMSLSVNAAGGGGVPGAKSGPGDFRVEIDWIKALRRE